MNSDKLKTSNLLAPSSAARSGSSTLPGEPPILNPSISETSVQTMAEISKILKGTHWPWNSDHSIDRLIVVVDRAVKELSSPHDITMDEESALKEFLSVLDGVLTKLRVAASQHGASSKASSLFHRSEGCNRVLDECRDEVTQGIWKFQEAKKHKERENDSQKKLKPLIETNYDSSSPKTTSKDEKQTRDIQETSSGNERGRANAEESLQNRKQRLQLASTVLSGINTVSGSIPIVGSYVGAVAQVGITCVEIVQTMDSNDEAANALEARTSRLSNILQPFEGRFADDDTTRTERLVQEMQRELQNIQDEVQALSSSSTFRKLLTSSDRTDALQGFQDQIKTALEELQLLLNFRTSDLVAEISSNQIREENDRLLNLLGDANYGAQGDLIGDVLCLPGTRVAILDRVDKFIRGGKETKRVLWILGMAGRGKSTMASTVAYKWKNRASVAMFHFRRGLTELQRRVICALARQLGNSPALEVKQSILQSLRENKDIAQERLESQFQFLVDALRSLKLSSPLILIIDAFDECEDVNFAVNFIRLIRRYADALPPQVKFLITCRPEAPLLLALKGAEWEGESLDLECNMDENEIRLFIDHSLSFIRERHSLPPNWPTPTDVNSLVKRSQCLFQWARTAMNYIGEGSPTFALEELLTIPSVDDGLDGLYKPILSKTYAKVKKNRNKARLFCDVLGLLVTAPLPISIDAMAYVFGESDDLRSRTQSDKVHYLREEILSGLSSLLAIPEQSHDNIRLAHTSLRDMLVSEDRCGENPYFVDLAQFHGTLAIKCFNLMLKDLHKNMCNLSDPSVPNSEIQGSVDRCVPIGLRYCCRAGTIHLSRSSLDSELHANAEGEFVLTLDMFCKEKLLGWMEIMSLIGEMKEAPVIARDTETWLKQFTVQPRLIVLASLWNDAHRLITEFQSTRLWEYYSSDAIIDIRQGPQATGWSSQLWSRSLADPVFSVNYSPDGSTVVSGGADGVVRLWDAETGRPVGKPLEAHPDPVATVAFSPDGKRIVSCSTKGTIVLWDVATGSRSGEISELQSHRETTEVFDFASGNICFSPDGKKIVAGWNTVCMWDSESRRNVGPTLQGHTGYITSIAFSPDGASIMTASGDGSLRLWDSKTGQLLVAPFEHSTSIRKALFAHDGRTIIWSDRARLYFTDVKTMSVLNPTQEANYFILSMAASNDGRLLATGTAESAITLWDLETKAMLSPLLTGHIQMVTSVVFSPDNRRIVSGSRDGTVRSWLPLVVFTQTTQQQPSTQSQELTPMQMMASQKDGASSSAVCAGTKKVAVGFDNGDVAMWDAQAGTQLWRIGQFHSWSVISLQFSPDGRTVASGSITGQVRIWNADTGQIAGVPFDTHSNLISLAYSPDGRMLAYGQADGSIRLRDSLSSSLLSPRLKVEGEVLCLAFAPKSSCVAVGCSGTIFLWDTAAHSITGKLALDAGEQPVAIAFSSDGDLLSVELKSQSFQLWNISLMDVVTAPQTSFSVEIGFPKPFIHLRVHDQWVLNQGRRLFWLPSRYIGERRLPVILVDSVILVIGYSNAVFDIAKALKHFPSLFPRHSELTDPYFQVTSISGGRRGMAFISDAASEIHECRTPEPDEKVIWAWEPRRCYSAPPSLHNNTL